MLLFLLKLDGQDVVADVIEQLQGIDQAAQRLRGLAFFNDQLEAIPSQLDVLALHRIRGVYVILGGAQNDLILALLAHFDGDLIV